MRPPTADQALERKPGNRRYDRKRHMFADTEHTLTDKHTRLRLTGMGEECREYDKARYRLSHD